MYTEVIIYNCPIPIFKDDNVSIVIFHFEMDLEDVNTTLAKLLCIHTYCRYSNIEKMVWKLIRITI